MSEIGAHFVTISYGTVVSSSPYVWPCRPSRSPYVQTLCRRRGWESLLHLKEDGDVQRIVSLDFLRH